MTKVVSVAGRTDVAVAVELVVNVVLVVVTDTEIESRTFTNVRMVTEIAVDVVLVRTVFGVNVSTLVIEVVVDVLVVRGTVVWDVKVLVRVEVGTLEFPII